jgi:hypothetical protein
MVSFLQDDHQVFGFQTAVSSTVPVEMKLKQGSCSRMQLQKDTLDPVWQEQLLAPSVQVFRFLGSAGIQDASTDRRSCTACRASG